LKLFF